MNGPAAAPRQALSVVDAVVIMAGVVIGAGIFRAPSIVADSVANQTQFIALWVLGGFISLVGALCYAELASTYPDTGGDYHFLHRALGSGTAFLFAWARLAVIQTGSIAVQAFVVGDYATLILPLGTYSPAIYAGLTVVIFTLLNVIGLRPGKLTQHLLTGSVVLALLLIIAVGWTLFFGSPPVRQPSTATTGGGAAGIGLAMVFVLLTYGGWNEVAYLSAEMRGSRRRIVGAFVWGITLITIIYVLVNLALLLGLGLPAMAKSQAVAADLMSRMFGENGARFISLVIVIAALSTINATIFTGARTSYALGRDFLLFAFLGRWSGRGDCPVSALVAQGVVTLALVLFGATMEKGHEGFRTMVDYTAPVFWFFFLLAGVSLFVLRYRDADRDRPFRVPFYPITPLLFCAFCLYMLNSSLQYTGRGALVGVGVLVAGVPLYVVARALMSSGQRAPGIPGTDSPTS